MEKKNIYSVEEFNQIAEENATFLIFKNSTTCPISLAAFEEYEKFVEDQDTVPCYYLNVQDARPLSNHIAEKYEIKHESPQALLFKNGEVVWNASHWKITYSSLQENVK
ncbi:bacillithiol system redox-active protein YtxJ [Sutcliffiella rhizosphaerae]|uniref:Bacillithiol system redox-active protein YtxJ n=1 Tax=Sutcliffiella rhizosphaerae TaxID=2880967 RepID=A0ABN8AGD3_9BACI|nr:bacillithiol system redox-active protein YtxJ [Sutcliffiella rhizosphaerae]CAG9622118.1 hypothetical protein BACCIP111883_02909 [Sutcliffiella rhizosphaerae]